LAVFGCLIQRYYRELRETFAAADILWGVNDTEALADAIAAGRPAVYPDRQLFLYNDTHQRPAFTTANSSFIKISEGCDMACSFCAIPQIRGPFRSRSIPSILREAEALKKRGVEELNLISQNSTHFGRDRGGPSLLPALLKAVSSLGFRWLRVLYLMPEEVTPEILEGFDQPSLLPYFDLPFQHVSPRILRKMRRNGGYAANLGLVRDIRRHFPGAVLRSTFIVGFPGESEDDFRQLLDFAAEAGLERIGVFAFSPEENTGCFALPGRKARVRSRKESAACWTSATGICGASIRDWSGRRLTSCRWAPGLTTAPSAASGLRRPRSMATAGSKFATAKQRPCILCA